MSKEYELTRRFYPTAQISRVHRAYSLLWSEVDYIDLYSYSYMALHLLGFA
jgi:hypothetical protein